MSCFQDVLEIAPAPACTSPTSALSSFSVPELEPLTPARCSIDCLDSNTSNGKPAPALSAHTRLINDMDMLSPAFSPCVVSNINHPRLVLRPMPWPSFLDDQAAHGLVLSRRESAIANTDEAEHIGEPLPWPRPNSKVSALLPLTQQGISDSGSFCGHPSSITANDLSNPDAMWYLDDIFLRLRRYCLDNQCMEQADAECDAHLCPERQRTGTSMQVLTTGSVLKIFWRGVAPNSIMADFLEIGIQ